MYSGFERIYVAVGWIAFAMMAALCIAVMLSESSNEGRWSILRNFAMMGPLILLALGSVILGIGWVCAGFVQSDAPMTREHVVSRKLERMNTGILTVEALIGWELGWLLGDYAARWVRSAFAVLTDHWMFWVSAVVISAVSIVLCMIGTLILMAIPAEIILRVMCWLAGIHSEVYSKQPRP
jgi:hypothetical protein